MDILVLNAGSSSLKYKLLNMPSEGVLGYGRVEKIGQSDSLVVTCLPGQDPVSEHTPCPDHATALSAVLKAMLDPERGCIKSLDDISVLGHRVVQGRDIFLGPTVVDDDVVAKMESIQDLAPLHMPATLACLRACLEQMPGTPQVVVFDTSFYSSMPAHARRYAVPRKWREDFSIRRYGFHGISHQYLTITAAQRMGRRPEELQLITMHLGAGISITAYDRGTVADTSMGFTPLEGVIMGTRSGSVDPSIIPYVCAKTGMSAAEVVAALNNEGGLAAVSGVGLDMRSIQQAVERGDPDAQLAFDMLIHTLLKFIGSYYFIMGGCDAFVFSGGIGENSIEVRAAIMQRLAFLGIRPDAAANAAAVGGKGGRINAPGDCPPVLVIPTNEELMIARQTFELINA